MLHRIPKRMRYGLMLQPVADYTFTTKAVLVVCVVTILLLAWSLTRVQADVERSYHQCVDEMHGRMRGDVCYVDMKDFPRR